MTAREWSVNMPELSRYLADAASIGLMLAQFWHVYNHLLFQSNSIQIQISYPLAATTVPASQVIHP